MTPGASHLTEKWAVPPWTIVILRKFNIDPAHSIFTHVINISIMRFIALRCWNLKPCLNCTESEKMLLEALNAMGSTKDTNIILDLKMCIMCLRCSLFYHRTCLYSPCEEARH